MSQASYDPERNTSSSDSVAENLSAFSSVQGPKDQFDRLRAKQLTALETEIQLVQQHLRREEILTAIEHGEKALKLVQELALAATEKEFEVRALLGISYQLSGQLDNAELHFEKSLVLRSTTGTSNIDLDIQILVRLGDIHLAKGDYVKSLKCHSEALESLSKLESDAPFEQASVMFSIAKTYYNLGDRKSGGETLENMFQTLRQIPKEQDLECAHFLLNIGNLFLRSNMPTDALHTFREAWTYFDGAKDKPASKFSVAIKRLETAAKGLEKIHRKMEEASRSLASQESSHAAITSEEVITIAEAVLSSSDRQWPEIFELAARCHQVAGKLAGAAVYFHKTIQSRNLLGDDFNRENSVTFRELALVHEELGEFEYALDSLNESEALLNHSPTPVHLDKFTVRLERARILSLTREETEATRAMADAFSALRDLPKEQYINAASLMLAASRLFMAVKRPDVAVQLLSDARSYFELSSVELPILERQLVEGLADALQHNGEFEEALSVIQEALQQIEVMRTASTPTVKERIVDQNPKTNFTRRELNLADMQRQVISPQAEAKLIVRKAHLLLDCGDLTGGERLLEDLLKDEKATHSSSHPRVILAQLHCANAKYSSYNLIAAEQYALEALSSTINLLPKEIVDILSSDSKSRSKDLTDYLLTVNRTQKRTFHGLLKLLGTYTGLNELLGSTSIDKNRQDGESLEYLLSAQLVREALGHFAEDDEGLAFNQIRRAKIERIRGNMEVAEEMLRSALRDLEHLPDAKRSWTFGIAALAVGELALEANDYREARKYLKQSFRVFERDPSTKDSYMITPTLLSLAHLHIANGNYERARDFSSRAEDILVRRGRTEHPTRLKALKQLEYIAEQLNDQQLAKAYHIKAMAVINQIEFLNDLVPPGDGPN